MSISLTRENYALHKLHSLTGVVPFGFYMLQHLTLNTFSIAGPERFNGVIGFFESVPAHLLLTVEILFLWAPMLFHAVYGTMIAMRAKSNYFGSKYGWSENRMFVLQRWSGLFLFVFILYHVISTTGVKYLKGVEHIEFAAMSQAFISNGYILLFFYMAGTLAATYHLAYGIWNFCIRWGITVSEKAQKQIQIFSAVFFVAVTVMAWTALAGFVIHKDAAEHPPVSGGEVY